LIVVLYHYSAALSYLQLQAGPPETMMIGLPQ
jgi:hypothetical protein